MNRAYHNKNWTRQGFTIVELLIVIVIIGILAAITVVAYNGIQQRAKNTQVVAGVEAYRKALMQYASVNSAYPTAGGCLGANYPSSQCWQGVSGNQFVSGTLDASLAGFMGSKPTLATSLFSIGIGDNLRAGALFTASPARIIYYLSGASQPCVLSGTSGVTEGGIVTQCSLALP